jgi:hypothetical protein
MSRVKRIPLVCASGETLAASHASVQRAGLPMTVDASTEPLDCDSSTGCFAVTSNSANITHVFVGSACASSPPSDYAITVDGEPVEKLYTDDGPCESIPRDVWFPLSGDQTSVEVCVTISGLGPKGIRVGAKAKDECVVSQP